MMTPISAMPVRNACSPEPGAGLTGAQPKRPQIAGPIRTPAMTAPTTCGRPSLRMSIPSPFVASRMTARSHKIIVISIFIRYLLFKSVLL